MSRRNEKNSGGGMRLRLRLRSNVFAAIPRETPGFPVNKGRGLLACWLILFLSRPGGRLQGGRADA